MSKSNTDLAIQVIGGHATFIDAASISYNKTHGGDTDQLASNILSTATNLRGLIGHTKIPIVGDVEAFADAIRRADNEIKEYGVIKNGTIRDLVSSTASLASAVAQFHPFVRIAFVAVSVAAGAWTFFTNDGDDKGIAEDTLRLRDSISGLVSDLLSKPDELEAEAPETDAPETGDDVIGNDNGFRVIVTNGTADIDFIDGLINVDNHIYGWGGNDHLYGENGNDTLIGGAGNDWLSGDSGNDILIGGVGDDKLLGREGDDSLTGGVGPDWLEGGSDNDIYLFARGFGVDTVFENWNGMDELQFVDIASSEVVSLTRLGHDLQIDLGSGDVVTVRDNFNLSYLHYVEKFSFSDGASWADRDIKAHVITNGTAGDDRLTGFIDVDSRLYGFDGDDGLYGENGNDTLIAGAGNDWLYGGSGEDTITGGPGTDRMAGGSGNDTYLFARGFGADIVHDHRLSMFMADFYIDSGHPFRGSNVDELQFVDIASSEVVGLTRLGEHLLIDTGGGDVVTVKNHFYSSEFDPVEKFSFSNGVSWSDRDIKSRVITNGTAGDETIIGYSGGVNCINGLGGDDHLYGESGNDILNGGTGNDDLIGGSGEDTLTGGEGFDWLNGGAGSDTYLFARGFGADTVTEYGSNGNVDELRFEDIASSEVVSLTRINNNLQIDLGSGDVVTVKDNFSSIDKTVEKFSFSDGVSWSGNSINISVFIGYGTEIDDVITGFSDRENLIYGDYGNDVLSGNTEIDSIEAANSNDKLYGESGNDILNGGTGNDHLIGGSGEDTLTGGAGTDFLEGGLGNDIYLFGRGFGVDIVSEYELYGSNMDELQFADIASSEVLSLTRVGDDLKIDVSGDDVVTIQGNFSSTHRRVERFSFSNDVSWSYSDIISRVITNGTAGDDSLIGFIDVDSRLYGFDGDDGLYGENGNDTLIAGAGNDWLHGGNGVDMLTGGTGTDWLDGGSGNDTYLFARGFGEDTVSEYQPSDSDMDELRFVDIASSEVLSLTRVGDDLKIDAGGGDVVTIQGNFSSIDQGVEKFSFSDGVSWSDNDINARVNANGMAGNNTSGGSGDSNVLNGGAGEDILNGGDGNDRIDGGLGNDVLDGGAGSDSLYGGEGSDIFVFARGYGADTLYDYDEGGADFDEIIFTDLAFTDIVYPGRIGDDLELDFGGGDVLTLSNYFSSKNYQIEKFTYATDVNMLEVVHGTTAADTITSITNKEHRVYALAGNDIVHGNAKDDYLNGGLGDDQLFGGVGNDLLIG